MADITQSPALAALYTAICAVEALGCGTEFTRAVVLLSDAMREVDREVQRRIAAETALSDARARAIEDAARVCELRAKSHAKHSHDYFSANEAGKCAVAVRWLTTQPERFAAALRSEGGA